MFFKGLFNKIVNKQACMILLDKVIGQAKILFNYISQKKPEEVIPEGLLGISINKNIIAIAHLVLTGLQDIIVKSWGVFIIDPTQESQSAQNIIAKYIKDYNLNNIECCYVLDSSQYVMSLIEAVTNDNKAQEKAILWGVKDYINYSIDDAILDYFEVPIVRARDNVKLAYAVAMRAKLSEDIGVLIKSAGATLKYIDIKELCLVNIISLYQPSESGCLLLNIFDENVNFLLIKDHALFISRTTKLDIKQLDGFDPIVNANDTKFSIAENLVLELQRSLDYGNNLFKDLNFNSISIVPCNINLDLFVIWAKEQLGLIINKIDLTEKIKFNININQKEQADCLLAIGAGLRKIGGFYNVSAN